MELELVIQLAKTAIAVLESNPELSKMLFKEVGKHIGVEGAAAAEKIAGLTKELDAAKETISSLTKQLGDTPVLGDKLKTAENTISNLNNKVSELTKQIDEYKNADIDKLKDENERLKKNIEALRKSKNNPAREKKEFTNAEKNQIIRKLHDKGYYIDTYNYDDSIEDSLDELTEDEIKVIKEEAGKYEKTKEAIRKDFFNNPKQVFIPGGPNKGTKESFV